MSVRMRSESSSNLKLSYLNQIYGQEDEILQAIRAKALELNLEGMQVSPHEGRILQSLVQWSGAKKIVEIGLFLGYSTLWMARALPPGGKIISLEKNKDHFQWAQAFLQASECAEKTELRLCDAEQELKKLEAEGPFDFVFIDANKGAYLQYLDWAERHVRPGGFIVGDNTFLFGLVYGEGPKERWSEKQIETMREFNARLSDPKKYQSCLLPTGEGMTVARKII